jgi:pilus assembly protein Flp/PilA
MQSHRRALERGAGLVEYALILVLVSIVSIGALTLTGGKIQQIFCEVTNKLNLAGGSGGPTGSFNMTLAGATNCETNDGKTLDVEAVLPTTTGNSVAFYIDSTLIRTETIYKYCLGGGDGPCDPQDISSYGKGKHTVRVVATNGGKTAEVSMVFFINR